MKMQWKMHRAKSLTGGGATCDFVAENGQIANVTIRGLRSTRALAHLGAMERVLNGAIVLDGADIVRLNQTFDALENSSGTGRRLIIREAREPLQRRWPTEGIRRAAYPDGPTGCECDGRARGDDRPCVYCEMIGEQAVAS